MGGTALPTGVVAVAAVAVARVRAQRAATLMQAIREARPGQPPGERVGRVIMPLPPPRQCNISFYPGFGAASITLAMPLLSGAAAGVRAVAVARRAALAGVW